MNRSIVMFVVLFVGVFGSAYLMMQGSHRPGASPPAGSVAKSADSDVSHAKDDEGKSASATATSDSKTMKDEANSSSAKSPGDSKTINPDANSPSGKSAGAATTKNREGKRIVQQDDTAPTPADSSPRNSNKIKRVYKRPAATWKPAEPTEPDDNLSDDDLDLFWGTWQIVDAEYDGRNIPEEAKHYSWEFQGDKYTINHNGNFAELWTVRLNSGKKPKTIDGTHKILGRKLMGIYEINGDTLKICYDLTGNGRPDSFKAAQGSRRVCYIFQRQ